MISGLGRYEQRIAQQTSWARNQHNQSMGNYIKDVPAAERRMNYKPKALEEEGTGK